MAILDLSDLYISYCLLSCYPNSSNIPHSPVVVIYGNLNWGWLPCTGDGCLVLGMVALYCGWLPCTADGCLVLRMVALRFSSRSPPPNSFPGHRIFQFQSAHQPCPVDTVYSLASSKRALSYFTVLITFHNTIHIIFTHTMVQSPS